MNIGEVEGFTEFQGDGLEFGGRAPVDDDDAGGAVVDAEAGMFEKLVFDALFFGGDAQDLVSFPKDCAGLEDFSPAADEVVGGHFDDDREELRPN